MLRLLLYFVLTVSVIYPSNASAEVKKVALLIGNQLYTSSVGPLVKPHDDVAILASALEQVGFSVTTLKDARYREMDVAIKRYVAELRGAGEGAIGFFYYSGHGVANADNNVNYLIPVDVERADTDDLWFHAFEQPTIIDRFNQHAGNAIHFVVFDACRNELNLTSSGKKSLGSERGFLPIRDVQRGMLIAYATEKKRTAADTGLFAQILAEEVQKPGVEAISMFRQVQLRAQQAMNQEPWLNYGALPQIYLAGRERPDVVKWTEIKESDRVDEFIAYIEAFPDSPFVDSAHFRLKVLRERRSNEAATKDWEVLEASTDIAELEAYIRKYPQHPYAKFAQARIEGLKGAEGRSELLVAWDAVSQSENVAALEQFIKEHPGTLFAIVAADKIAVLKNKAAEPGLSADELAAKFWEEIRASNDAELFKKFVERFPASPLSVLAASRFRELREQQQAALPAEPQPSQPAAESVETPPSHSAEISVTELTRSFQRELHRVGCNPGRIDGVWGAQGRQAVERFNKHTRLELDALTPTLAALEIIRKQTDIVCPKLAFDGTWSVQVTRYYNCRSGASREPFSITVTDGQVSGQRDTRGQVTSSGRLEFTRRARSNRRDLRIEATLSGQTGNGTLVALGTDCRGDIVLSRNAE
jgi:uncharacterized caspase-like protein/peptidoglycan hydrolase-like protein with peptidoglycan-binding domain